ncbi:MAG: inositol monophosphatase family protein [Dehalococcoidia bacterium]
MQPDDATLGEIEKHAVELAQGAGRILGGHFGKTIDVQFKADDKTDPVSQADKESEEYLKSAIKSLFPDHGILGEEGTDEAQAGSEFLWALDPLDGTVNFINGLPVYSASIGVLHSGEPVVGSIWIPSPGASDGSVYHARRSHGAYIDGVATSIRRNQAPQPGQLAVMPGLFRRRLLQGAGRQASTGETRVLGSIAYEMALTASGVLQYAIFTSPGVWDVAAGVVLVRAAGGAALTYDYRRSRWQDMGPFPVPGPADADDLKPLRDWRAPVMVGSREMVEHLARVIRPGWFTRLITRLRWG